MANYTTAADILDDALFRAHEPTDGTSDLDAQALVYLVRVIRALCMGGGELVPGMAEDWWWLRKEGTFVLDTVMTTGTAAVTNNNTSVTLSGVTTASSYVNWYFKVDGHNDVFKVSAGASAVLTLDTVYTGDTAASGAYKLMHLDYDVATDCIKIISPMQVWQGRNYFIYQTTLDRMQSEYPFPEAGVPQKFAPVDENTVRFSHYGETATGDFIRVNYDYVQLPTDVTNATTSVPLVPIQYRHVLSDWVTAFLMKDKDEAEATNMFGMARSGVIAMQKENRARWVQTGKQGHIYPRQRQVRSLIKTENGLIIR